MSGEAHDVGATQVEMKNGGRHGLDVRTGIRAALGWGAFGGLTAAAITLFVIASELWNLLVYAGE